MANSYHRKSTGSPSNVNLYCAQCESQIGIFDNEWIRLTSSYARSKEKGTHFSTEIGERTQVVPSGPAQRQAEGCAMAEIFCRKCSNMVGQYCKTAPDAEKEALVDQYFYKMSRTFLKDSRTNVRVEPVFGYGSDIINPTSSRSSIMPRSSKTPVSRWATTPLRQQSRTPATVRGESLNLMRRDSQDTIPITDIVDNKWEETSAELRKIRDELRSQRSTQREQSETIASQTLQFSDQIATMQDQQAIVQEHESCLAAQAARIVEQDEMIKFQSRRLEEQRSHMSKITEQLTRLQKTMDELRTTLNESWEESLVQRVAQSGNTSSGDIETILEAVRSAQNSAREVQTLRAENQTMKSRLNNIVNAVGAIADVPTPSDPSPELLPSVALDSTQVLGKRKRHEAGRLPSLELGNPTAPRGSALASFQCSTEQMPTPQSSEDGHGSPAQPSLVSATQARKEQPSHRQRESTKGVQNESRVEGAEPSIPKVTNKDVSSTANNQVAHQQAVPNGTVLPDDHIGTPKDIRRKPVSRSSRGSSSAIALRKEGRVSGSGVIPEIADTDEEVSPYLLPNNSSRRLTRSATKIVQPSNVTDGMESTVSAAGGSDPVPITADEVEDEPNTDARRAFLQSYLPNIQMASSVLGMNLEALIASSQALTQLESQNKSQIVNPIQQQCAEDNIHEQQQNASESIEDDDLPNHQVNNIQVDNSCDQALGQDDIMDFVQDSGIHDILDTSDDDDEPMQPDIVLYGQDSDDDGGYLPEEDGMLNAPEVSNSAPRNTRYSRSTAPEPIKNKKRIRRPRSSITLDSIHIATPQMFTDAYAAGQEPKLLRPPAIPTRARELNEELVQLGLSQWIGKEKRCREYRAAVTAARARLRNLNKAAFLSSHGLHHSRSEPASILPEEIAWQAQVEIANESPRIPQESPQPTSAEVDEATTMPDQQREDAEVNQESARTTRARTRRSSIPLVAGLEEVRSTTAHPKGKRTSLKRQSAGRRKSQKASETTIDDEQADVAAASSVQHENTHQSLEDVSGPQTSVLTEDQLSADILATEETAIDADERSRIHHVSAPRFTISIPRTSGGKHVDSITSQSESLKSQAQQREEAILLRDRMAKELMEREDAEI